MAKKYKIAFVFIVENGDLENKAILLGESLRRFFPYSDKVPIFAVRPRKGKEIHESTLDKFKELGIVYVYKPVNIKWKNLPFANEAYGSALIEDRLKDDTEVLVYLDADIVLLKNPEKLYMPDNIKALVTPIDVFVSNAAKYNEKLPMSYKFAYELNKVDLKKLWPVFTKIDKVEIYPSFNSGFIAVRPEVGIFRKWREMFEVSVRVGYFGIINPFSAQFFFTDQVFLSSVIVSMLGRSDIEILDDGYNFPLNFAQRIYNVKGKIDLNEITFLHYHHSFYDMNWTEFFNADDPNISWLIHKLPLFKDKHTAVYRHKVEYIKQYILYCYWKIKLILVPLNKTDNPKEKSSVVSK